MQRSGVLRILLQNGFCDRRCLHVCAKVPSAVTRSKQRERIECGGFVIVGILLVQPAHRRCVREIAVFLCTLSVENFDSGQIRPFPFGGRIRRQALQRRAG
jgi:hypothetical protein